MADRVKVAVLVREDGTREDIWGRVEGTSTVFDPPIHLRGGDHIEQLGLKVPFDAQ